MKPEIIKAVVVTAELTGTNLTEGGAEAMVKHLSAYDTQAVLEALERCQLELRAGAFTLGAVIDRLDDGHPGPEVAWAMVYGLEEDDSVVWTQEIAESYGLVRGMLRDQVAARVAFLEAYRRRLAKARRERRPPVWWASLGFDAGKRAAVLEEAVRLGRLAAPTLREMLPPGTLVEVESLDGKAMAQGIVRELTRRMIAEKRLPAAEGTPTK